MVIYNINRGCFIPDSIEVVQPYIFITYCNHTLIFKGIHNIFGCQAPAGRAELNIETNKIVIDYESGPKDQRKKYKFIGVKK